MAIPLLASPQGVAERSNKYREASADREDGVVSDGRARKTTPSASASEASRHFLDDAATPPCFRLRAVALALRGGDARRGMAIFQFVHNFFSRGYILSPLRG